MMTKTQWANQAIADSRMTRNTSYSIEQAAQEWIAMIEAPTTAATPEAKAALIARIREALPKVRVSGAENFPMACNEIKRVMSR